MPFYMLLRNSLSPVFFFSLLCTIALVLPLHSAVVDDAKSQLRSVQKHISEKEKTIQLQKQQRRRLLNQLQIQEKSISEISQKMHKTKYQLTCLNKDIVTLTHFIDQLLSQQKQQKILLAQQLEAAFRQGKQSGLQLLLSGKESQRSERILSYFNYLNKMRQKNIIDLQKTCRNLSVQKENLLKKQNKKKNLLNIEQTQKRDLEMVHAIRKKTLVMLENTLEKGQYDLLEMRKNESYLLTKIIHAERKSKKRTKFENEKLCQSQMKEKLKVSSSHKSIKKEYTLMSYTGGLGPPNKQAYWPIRGGHIKHHFGEILQGELRWKGLVIDAPEGTEVRAIADGRVLIADWLQGYGLVVVLEHGKGDMSLYGYNKSALVRASDQIRAGQYIALVGTGGKRGTPSLYFEIRRQGKAVNPLPWLGK